MRYILCTVLLFCILSVSHLAKASCGAYADFLWEDSAGTYQCQNYPGGSFVKRVFYQIYWTDGFNLQHYVLDSGTNKWYYSGLILHCDACYPAFNTPFVEYSGATATWVQITNAGTVVNGNRSTSSTNWRQDISHTCVCHPCIGEAGYSD